jgi:hypothetical protein
MPIPVSSPASCCRRSAARRSAGDSALSGRFTPENAVLTRTLRRTCPDPARPRSPVGV